MTRRKPLGSAEREVLERLRNHAGTWIQGDTPLWEGSAHWTLHILGSLAHKGYVHEIIRDAHFEMTAEGHNMLTS